MAVLVRRKDFNRFDAQTRMDIKCGPGNKACGKRCIPQDQKCRSGGGAGAALAVGALAAGAAGVAAHRVGQAQGRQKVLNQALAHRKQTQNKKAVATIAGSAALGASAIGGRIAKGRAAQNAANARALPTRAITTNNTSVGNKVRRAQYGAGQQVGNAAGAVKSKVAGAVGAVKNARARAKTPRLPTSAITKNNTATNRVNRAKAAVSPAGIKSRVGKVVKGIAGPKPARLGGNNLAGRQKGVKGAVSRAANTATYQGNKAIQAAKKRLRKKSA